MKKLLLVPILYLFSFLCQAAPLPAADAFQLSVKQVDSNNFSLTWQIKPGYFLYRDRLKVEPDKNNTFYLSPPTLPEPVKKTDARGQTYLVYRNQLMLTVSVLGQQAGEGLVTVYYQGCADDGFCYPPETQQIKLTIDKHLALTTTDLYTPASNTTKTTQPPSTTTSLEAVFNHHWLIVLAMFFGFGLLLSFTPCILPMVPVLSGIIIGHGAIATRKAFLLSLSYVVSMAVTYAIIGALVASLGSNLQIMMQTPWVIGLFSLLFLALALSMFGFFELKLPISWQAKLASVSRNQHGGEYLGAAIMGCLSILILSPCVTAPLIGVLSYIAHDGNIVMGGLSLFFLSLGMGTPLILIGTSAGHWLPKAGVWMNTVKAFFGVLLLAVAINLLGRILPASLVMFFWASLFIFSGVFAGAFITGASATDKCRKAVGIILLAYGLLLLVGSSMGNSNPLQPLALHSTSIEANNTFQQSITSVPELEQAIAQAQAMGKPVMLDFYADWCTSCKIMEKTTFGDPLVRTALKHFVVLKVDITANTAEQQALLKKYNVVAPPTFLFFNASGIELNEARLVGETNGNDFLRHLQSLIPLPHDQPKS